MQSRALLIPIFMEIILLIGGKNCVSARKMSILRKTKRAGGSFKFVWGQGYAHLRSYIRDGFLIVGAHRKIVEPTVK